MIVSFDFDCTICNEDGSPCNNMLNLLRNYVKEGDTVYIVTGRNECDENYAQVKINYGSEALVKTFIEKHALPIHGLYFTNLLITGERKGRKLKELGSELHYDDNIKDCQSAFENGITSHLVKNDKVIRTLMVR